MWAALEIMEIGLLLEGSDSEDRSQDVNNLRGGMAGGYLLYSMEENASLDPTLTELTENTDALTTVVMAKGAAGPTMFTAYMELKREGPGLKLQYAKVSSTRELLDLDLIKDFSFYS
jgi:hypothetical protein